MPRSNGSEMECASQPKAIRRGSDATRPNMVAGTGKAQKPSKPASNGTRTPPPNARVVQPSYKTGTVSRAAVRAVIKRLGSTS
jgi:hypothetical protein